jgi:hypothetical protein
VHELHCCNGSLHRHAPSSATHTRSGICQPQAQTALPRAASATVELMPSCLDTALSLASTAPSNTPTVRLALSSSSLNCHHKQCIPVPCVGAGSKLCIQVLHQLPSCCCYFRALQGSTGRQAGTGQARLKPNSSCTDLLLLVDATVTCSSAIDHAVHHAIPGSGALAQQAGW